MHPSWEAQQLYLQALALGAAGRLTEAHKLYRKAIELDPKRADFWNGEGFVFCMEGRFDEALACYDRAIALDNSIADAWNGRGYALAALHKYAAAEDSFQHALRIKPGFAYAWSGLGMIWNMSGRSDEAFNACRHAAQLDTALANAWFHMASALASSPAPIPDADDMTAASCLCRAVHLQETSPQTFPIPPCSLFSMATELNLPLLALRISEQHKSATPCQTTALIDQTICRARLARDIMARIKHLACLQEAERELLCGIMNLLNGDPMSALAHLERADTLDEDSAAIQYFLIMSLRCFCEPADNEIAFALNVARKNSAGISQGGIEQVYYSGLILDIAGQPAEAVALLAKAADHRPSLYARWHILRRLDPPHARQVLARILDLETGVGTFLRRCRDGSWTNVPSPQPALECGNLPAAIRLSGHFFELGKALAAALTAANKPL